MILYLNLFYAVTACCMAVFFQVSSVSAATYTVPGTHASITAANAAAASGDTILVGNGIYEESFTTTQSVITYIASSGRPVIRYAGTQQTISGWAGGSVLICAGAYGDNVTFVGFEFDGINGAGTDTCTNLVYTYGRTTLRDCILHGTHGYLFRSNRNGGAYDCEFYGPAGSGWRALRPDSVANCRFHGIGTALYSYGVDDGVFQNNVIYECGTAVYSRGTEDNFYINNLIYHCTNGYYAGYLTGDFDPSLRPTFINNTIICNQRHGIRFSGKDNAVFKNNIIYWNGLEDTSAYWDMYAVNNNKPGWDITYNCIGRYSDSLDNTFADSINCIGNVFDGPLLADTAAGDTANGFYLLVHSPCIDAGNQGIRDPDGSPSDMGCYGGPVGRMKAPGWLANLGAVVHTPSGFDDDVTWPQYDVPGNFGAYMVYHDTTTTDMRYTVGPANLVDSVTAIATTSGTYPHTDSTWYRISVAGDSTGHMLGGGYTEMDTVFPRLLAAYYYCNGTRDPSDDELRLVFNEGIYETGVNLNAPGNYLRITGEGAFGDAVISSVNEFVVAMDSNSTMMSHNRSWVSVRADSLADYYGNAVVGSVEVTTFNVRNLDNGNDFETVGQAVMNATSDDFLAIFDDGHYNEQITLNLKALTLQADSLADPVVNAQGARDYGVLVTADSCRVVGIRCDSALVAGIAFSGTQGGWAVLDTCTGSATGILCINDSNVTVRRSVTFGNADGIRTFNGYNTSVVSNISRDNTDDGIVGVNSASTEIRNNVCYANAGDGVETSGGGSGTVTNTAMLGNGTDLNNAAAYTAANNATALTAAFTDTAANDFTLQQSSPLWGAGEYGENIGRYEGRVWRKGVGTKYHSIMAAYCAAADDETLLVCPGRYYETLEIGKGITILADSGSGHTLVHDEYPYHSGLYWNVYQTGGSFPFNLDGFTLDGENANVGYDNAGWGSNEHYGIYALNGRISNVTVTNLTHYASSYIPFGMYAGAGTRVMFDSCRVENAGYVLLAGNGSRHTARYCSFGSTAGGIAMQGDRDTVRNCVFGTGNVLQVREDADYNVIHNNILHGGRIRYALTAGDAQYGNKYLNNTFIGADTVMRIYGDNDTLINNIIIGGAVALEIRDGYEDSTRLYYNDITGTDATGATSVHWNLAGAAFADPMFADSANGDFYLLWNSPLIDRGDLRIADPDGGRSDIGCYGGRSADTLAPAMLDSFTTALGDTGFDDLLTWDWYGNDPGDFKHYAVYRDTTGPNFQPSAVNLLDTITNVATKSNSYADNGKVWFYKISAVDTDLYGGGYALFDTIAPWIDTAIYYCNGTPDFSDDTLVLVMSEWIIDMAAGAFDSSFRVLGLGSGSGAHVSTGSQVNDDTLIVTGIDTVFSRLRTWIGFRDTATTDYVRNLNGKDTVAVTTYNVGLLRTGGEYELINDAYADAVDGDSIVVVDAGLYPEQLVLQKSVGIVGYGIDYPGIDSLPVIFNDSSIVGTPAICSLAAACTLVSLQMVSNTDTLDCIHIAHNQWVPHLIRKCRFNGTATAPRGIVNQTFSYQGALQIDSCEFFGFTSDAMLLRRMYVDTVKVIDNIIRDISGGHGIFLRDGNTKIVKGNTFTNIDNNPGALRITAEDYVSVYDNTFSGCDGNEGLISLDWDCDSIIIARNVAYDCSNDSGALQMKHASKCVVTGNMFYNCYKGITQWQAGSPSDSCYGNIIAFNTVANCTSGGISIRGKAAQPDTVFGNICWGNGAYDFNNTGSGVPAADYNWFTGGTNTNWPRGPESDSGYPAFTDTSAGDFTLLPASPCLNFTGYETPAMAALGIDTVDLYGTVRANPSYSYWDAGAYEGGGGPPRVDSAAYWSCGTQDTGDDSMIVWFRRIAVDAGSVPTGAGDADLAFGMRITGGIGNATITVPGGGDTNVVVIHMSGTDTLPSRLRNELLLRAGVIMSALDGAAALADTDSVDTWNVSNITDGADYRTIFAAIEDTPMGDDDTVVVFDDGYYTDTLFIDHRCLLTNAGSNFPQIRYDGDLMDGSWRGSNLLIWANGAAVLHGLALSGINLAETDTNARIYMGSGGLRACSLAYVSTYFNANVDTIRDTRFHNSNIYYRGTGACIRDNSINGSGGNGLEIYNGNSALVMNNRITNCAGSGLYQRNAYGNTYLNNVFADNAGYAMNQYGAPDISYGNVFRNNVFYGNGNGAYLDSMCVFENNILYNNGTFELRRAGAALLDADSIRYNMADSANSRLGALFAHPGNVVNGADPLFADAAAGDFHLLVHSPAIDRGDTTAVHADFDGGRNDMGSYGGPAAFDTLMPHRLDTMAAFSVAATGYGSDTLSWSAYSLPDHKFFAVYRGLDGGFVPAETNCIDSIFNMAAQGARYANDGQAYVYKVSAVDSSDYGGGYQSATYARIFLSKTTHQTHTVPGDTMTYAVYYDNDGEIPTADTFEVVDGIPVNTVYLDTLNAAPHTGGVIEVDWYDGAWRDDEPGDPATVRAIRWRIAPAIGAQADGGDAAGADDGKTGIDTTGGDDAGTVYFRVRVQ